MKEKGNYNILIQKQSIWCILINSLNKIYHNSYPFPLLIIKCTISIDPPCSPYTQFVQELWKNDTFSLHDTRSRPSTRIPALWVMKFTTLVDTIFSNLKGHMYMMCVEFQKFLLFCVNLPDETLKYIILKVIQRTQSF